MFYTGLHWPIHSLAMFNTGLYNWPTLSCNVLHWPALSCNVLHWPTLSCNVQYCPSLSCNVLHWPLHCLAMFYTAPCTILQCSTLFRNPFTSRNVLHYSTLPFTVLQCSTLFRTPFTVPQCSTLFYTALHCLLEFYTAPNTTCIV